MIYTNAQAILIFDVAGLDPITAYLEDHEPGRGTLTVRCFDRAWTCYWGGMGNGKSLVQFIASVDAGYIAGCLVRGVRGIITKREVEYREEAYVQRIAQALKDAVAMDAAAAGSAS